MDELQREKNKLKKEAKKINKQSTDSIKEEIKENYEIGIEYYKDVEK